MSGDEVFALVVCGAIAIWGWREWAGGLLLLPAASCPASPRILAGVMPLAAGTVIFLVLDHWSAHDVRDDAIYIFFYFVMWLGWTGLWNELLSGAGLNSRDDVLERHNLAAGLAIGGGLLGVTFVFAGSNIGDGPGWWVVVFCAALGTVVLLLLWLLTHRICRIQEIITIDRDVAAGWRTGGFFAGGGLILGRAVAGTWHSAGQTLHDFGRRGWPVLLLWVLAAGADWLWRPSPKRQAPGALVFGFLPGLFFLLCGAISVWMEGSWE